MLLLPPGDVDRLKLVGSGGFGLVYRGWSKTLRMEIALKMIQGSHGSSLKKLMRDLKKEENIMQKASNPHVLRLLGVYDKPEGNLMEHGLVMEYMPYGSLRSLFDDIPDVPWALRFQILHQVVLGMIYLHSLNPPIIHRDLKPSNVLLSRHLDVQITDFGLSRIVGATSSATPSCAGTLAYMAPEALLALDYQPTKSYDVYSYGILIWTMFSAEEPYPGIPVAVIQRCVGEGQRPNVSVLDQFKDIKMVPEAKELMIRCWNQNAENRPSFHDCSENTALMFEAYTSEVLDAVRKVQDLLNETSSDHQIIEASGTLEDYSGFIANLIQENAIQTDQEPENSEDEVKKEEIGNATPIMPSEDIHENNDISQTDILKNNITKAIKGSGDYNKIRNRTVSPQTSSQDPVDAADFLRTNFPQIVQAKPDLNNVLDVLFSKHIVTQEELNFLTTGSIHEQVRKTLRMIMNKGQETCMEFLRLMNQFHTELMRSLT